MVLRVCKYGEAVLRRKAEPVAVVTDALRRLADDMVETMHHADGCGLAAPQIGVSLRVAVVNGDVMEDVYPYLKGFRRTFINPVVVSESETTCEYNEGCLSVPGVYADVRRPESITVEYYDENLEKKTETFDKFAARMIQHEMDHLNGILFVDHASPIRRKMLSGKLQGILKGKVHPHYNVKFK